MSIPYQKDIVNTIYHSLLTTGLTLGYLMIGKKLIKLDVGDPSRPDIASAGKLVLAVTAAEITKGWLVKQKIIPDDIIHAS
jgi:hypothetical protein